MEHFDVLIVEDDFRIADLIAARVDQSETFQTVKKTKTGEETLRYLREASASPAVILLDVYIPDVAGLELLWSLKNSPARDSEIIMITAATETETIREALLAGIFDYIIKPIDFERLDQSLRQIRQKRMFLHERSHMNQQAIDAVVHKESESSAEELPKGIDSYTLKRLKSVFAAETESLSAFTAARYAGVSRPTARRYLEYLAGTGYLEVSSNYGGEPGRPKRLYYKK
ncbi:response regulator [Alteribacillus sp. HJP-4]|uniref:response regulator n=1 Tax=Alteribacillus sp. HJP-4 TaxID=2775394 RepID=UPI0035CD12D0